MLILPAVTASPTPPPSVPALIEGNSAAVSQAPVRRIKWTPPQRSWDRWATAHWPEFPQLAKAGTGRHRGVYLSRLSIGLAASIFTLCGGIAVLAVSTLTEGTAEAASAKAFARTLPVVTATLIEAPNDSVGGDATWVKQNQDRVERPAPRKAAATENKKTTLAKVEPAPSKPAPSKPAPAVDASAPEGQAQATPATPAAEKTASTRELAQPGNLRAAPNGRTIGVVPKGEEVEVRNCALWCLVSYKGQQGYVYKALLRDSDDDRPAAEKPGRAT